MVRAMVTVIMGLFFFSFGETGNSKETIYLGRWVGDPTRLLENLGYIVMPAGSYAKFCAYGYTNASELLDKLLACVKEFEDEAKHMCSSENVTITHYGIANLRMSHSNTITSMGTYNKYGHFLIVYGDVLCAVRMKNK